MIISLFEINLCFINRLYPGVELQQYKDVELLAYMMVFLHFTAKGLAKTSSIASRTTVACTT